MLRVLVTGNWLLAADLSRLQKVVIARRIQAQVPHAPRVHEHVIEVPQIYRRNIVGEDFLNLGVEPLAGILIGLTARMVDQAIDPGIGIEAAVPSRLEENCWS